MTKNQKNTTLSYVVITPARNEEKHIRSVIESMINQLVPPREWVIVDDGSSDKTEEIARAYTLPWIKVLRLTDRRSTERGGKVVAVFNEGYQSLTFQDYDFIVKLDGDVTFDPDYFSNLLNEFRDNPRLGIAGGAGREMVANRWIDVRIAPGHVCGATKIYRRACFEQIGGLVECWGWDGIDQLKAEMAGWQTQTFAECTFLHLRPEGGKSGRIRGRFEQGRASYIMGYSLLFMVFRGARRMASQPYILGGLALIIGYIWAFIKKSERFAEHDIRMYLQRKQATYLKHIFSKPLRLFGKKKEI